MSSTGAARIQEMSLKYGVVIVLILLLAVAQMAYPQFLTLINVQNMFNQNAGVAIVAAGMTFVMIGGGFDLSVGGIFGLGSVIFAGAAVGGAPIVLALVCAILAGVACGIVNGLVVAKLKVNAFVATIGSAAVFSGIAALYSSSTPIAVPFEVVGFEFLGSGRLLGVRVSIVLLFVLYVGGGLILAKAVYGRQLYATGGNQEASRLAGIRVERVQIVSFVIVGALAGLGGAFLASTLSTGQFDQGGPNIALDAIAAVVIGGTSLFGGEGAMWRTAVGVAILATMNNLFSSLSVESPTQNIIKGAVLISAVALDGLGRRRY